MIGSSGNTNEEKSKKMRSVYVEDPNGDLVHKRTLLKIINSGRALRKSMDRAKRVRGDARHGNGKESADSCVKRLTSLLMIALTLIPAQICTPLVTSAVCWSSLLKEVQRMLIWWLASYSVLGRGTVVIHFI